MNDYKIIIEILIDVLNNKNLTDVFNAKTSDLKVDKLNISKIKDITFGVIRNYFLLKTIINSLVSREIKERKIFIILLILLYEIEFTKKPDFAVTNEGVNLSVIICNTDKYKKFINWVLRNFIRKKNKILDKLKNDPECKYGLALWLIKKIKAQYPNNYNLILEGFNGKPVFGLRVNNKILSLTDYTKLLDENLIGYKLHENKIIIEKTLSVDQIPLFENGGVSIQDVGAQLLIDKLDILKSDYVLDACSAPGGKACAILENYDVSSLLAIDIDSTRVNKILSNLKRLNLEATVKTADASHLGWWDGNKFDKIIADVPCSAIGTIKRNPDIKITRKDIDINNFVELQRNIVLNLWNCLKVGGKMFYITCSILREENEYNVEYFMNNLRGCKKIQDFTIVPTKYNDGFYYCALKKIK